MHFLGAIVDVLVDCDKNLKAIFYQTPEMQQNFRQYPELVMIDATYKLNDLRMPLFLLLVVDGNGQSEIVALWIAADEERDTIKQMLQSFKTHNENHAKVTCVMADKDLTERAVIASELANAHLLICLFHTMRSFKREISCDKLGITSGQRNLALELMQKLAYSASEEAYARNYKELLDTKIKPVISYYNDNWHSIRDQWVEGLKNNFFNMLNRTNNRLESLNQKIKSVVSRNSSLTTFWSELMQCLTTLETERDQKAVRVQLKTPIGVEVAIKEFSESLTPFAFGHIQKQYNLLKKTNILAINADNTSASFKTTSGNIQATPTSCQCSFFTVMQLPCRHIMAFRNKLTLALCDISSCHVRWTKRFYLSGHRIAAVTAEHDYSPVIIKETRPTAITSSHQKYREAFAIGQKIASCVSELGMRDYTHIIRQLKNVKKLLEEGKMFSVVGVDEHGQYTMLQTTHH